MLILLVLQRHVTAFAALPASVRWYIVAEALAAFATGAFGAVYNLYVLALGFDTAFLGTLLVAGMVGAGASVLPAGALVDRVGARVLLLGGSVVVAAGVGAQLVAPTGTVLLVGSALAGAGGAAFYVAAAPFLAQSAPSGRLNDVFSLVTAATLAGAALGSAVAGQVAAVLGGSGGGGAGLAPPAPLAGYRAALIVGSAVGAASFLALALTRDVRPPRRQARELAGGDVAGGTSGPVWRTVLADATVQRLTATTALIGMGAGLFLPFLNVYFVEVLGASPAVYGWVSAGGTLTRLGATLLAPGLAARRGTVTAIAGSQIASVPFLILLGFAPHLTVAAVAVLVRGALMNMASPLLASFTMGALRQDLRGGANAVLLLVANVSRAGATLAGGALIAQVGYRWPYGLTALLYLASAALFWWWFGRDTSRAAPENATPEHGAPEHGAPD